MPKPLPSGRLMSRIARSGASAAKRLQRRARVGRLDDDVTRPASARNRRAPAGPHRRRRPGSSLVRLLPTGSVTVNRVRPCGRALAATRAAVTLDDGLHDPQARGPGRAARAPGRRRDRSARRSSPLGIRRRRGLRPRPDARTSAPVRSPPTRIVPPSGPNLLAFASRLTNTCVSRGASPSDVRQVVGHGDLERLAALCEQTRHQLAGVAASTSRERDRAARGCELPRLDAHALEQVVDQTREPQRAALQRRRPARRSCSRGMSCEVVLQQLERRELRRERRAEFVRDVGEDRIARAARRLEVRLVAHHLHLQAVHHARARDDHGALRPVGPFAGTPSPAPGSRSRAAGSGRPSRRARRPSLPTQGFSTSPQKRPIAVAGRRRPPCARPAG